MVSLGTLRQSGDFVILSRRAVINGAAPCSGTKDQSNLGFDWGGQGRAGMAVVSDAVMFVC